MKTTNLIETSTKVKVKLKKMQILIFKKMQKWNLNLHICVVIYSRIILCY